MKIRILNNTIRFRVARDELEALAEGQSITSATHFLSDVFMVQVKSKDQKASVDYSKSKIRLTLNADMVKAINSNESEVGLSFVQGDLSVLFEKDFQCLTDRAEDESNLFVNPKTSHSENI